MHYVVVPSDSITPNERQVIILQISMHALTMALFVAIGKERAVKNALS